MITIIIIITIMITFNDYRYGDYGKDYYYAAGVGVSDV